MSDSTKLNAYPKKWLAFIGVVLLSFGCYLDYTVVNVALPTIQQDFQVSLAALQWVMNIYFLVLCVLATAMGRLGDLFGRSRCFYMGAGIFTIASVMAGLSPNITWLILGRLLQGIGGAIVFPLGPSLLPQSFPKNERAKAIGWFGSLGGISLALGPVLGGLIVTYWGWRWIFFINVPICLAGFLFCFNSINEVPVQHKNISLDIKGMLLLALTMAGIVLSLINSQTRGWENSLTLTYLVVGIVAGVFLVKVERNQPNPLVDFNDFSNFLFFSGAILCFLAGLLSAVTLFFDPLYLQIIQNQSPQLSGFVLFAIPIAVFLVAFMVGTLTSRLGIINTIILGLLLASLSALMQVFFNNDTSLPYIIVAFICLGSMWALGNTVSIIAAQNAVGHERMSVATGTVVTMFNIGGSIGLALAIVIYHFVASHSLENKAFAQTASLNELIVNPSSVLQITNTGLIQMFNKLFIDGFVGVMWFLFILSLIALMAVFLRKISWSKK